MTTDTQGEPELSPSNAQSFLTRCGSGRLLAIALGRSGSEVTASPALLELIGEPLTPAKVSELLDSKDEAAVRPAAVLVLADGTRVVGFQEPPTARLSRVLDRFAAAHSFTRAERAALQDIAGGTSAKESAGRLGLSPETVRARRKRIFQKVGVGSCGEIQSRLLALI